MSTDKITSSTEFSESEIASQPGTNGSWGIQPGFEDALGQWHRTDPRTEQAILAAMNSGDESYGSADTFDPVIAVCAGQRVAVPGGGTLHLESGESINVADSLPLELPLGYHQLQRNGDPRPVLVIVSPGSCWLPDGFRIWGWSVQLYAARSRESWGIGDFDDLGQLARWSRDQLGAGMMLVSPLGASTPIVPQQSSPYYPSSRVFLNPLALHVRSIPGAELVSKLSGLTADAQNLNRDRFIDRDRVFALKMEAFEALWRLFAGDESFDAFCRERGTTLELFAAFCAIAEKYGSGWHSWPVELQHPAKPEVREFVTRHHNRVDFHRWLQWLADQQLGFAAKSLKLVQDLPIGVDPDGADAWVWQDVIATDAAVGAPPDEFNVAGQNWGLPPYVPHKLRSAHYDPFIQTIRAAFRHCGGLRIDHVMGLFRLFWIPKGMSPAEGAYVRYAHDELLAIIALESVRAGAFVVGEDLGTVEEKTREELAARNILSYRLLWFEKGMPDQFPAHSLAAITTHDLPTIAGLWTGADLERQEELNLHPNRESIAEIRERLAAMVDVPGDPEIADVIVAAHQALAQAPACVLSATLDDAAAVTERPNIPATNQDQNPNWCLGLPLPIEDLMQSEITLRVARALRR